MADQELGLKDALSMFVQGAKSYGLSKAISDAQDQVQQIKMAGLKSAEQRQALGSVSQNLIAQMSGMGADAATVQNMRLSMKPPEANTVDEMMIQAAQSGNTEEMAQAKKIAEFHSFLKERQIAAGRMPSAAQDKATELKNAMAFEGATKHISDKVNEYNASSRSVAGRLGNVVASVKEAKALLAGDMFTRMSQVEAAKTIDKILSGGASTISGAEELAPKTSAGLASDIMLRLTNKPTDMGAPELKKYYSDIIERMESTTQAMIGEGKLGAMKAYSQTLARDPERGRQYISDMTGLSPDAISFNARGGLEIKPGARAVGAPASAPVAAPIGKSSFLKPL